MLLKKAADADYLQFLLLLSVALVVRLVLRCWVLLVDFFWVPLVVWLVVLVLRLVVLFV
ncbi:MAG TPA: hypothetical protein K8V20_11305 [Subdoligranulum variabile]|uniref:Transmembrane protein n=1 Tax=Subdoligranulum variabile TaxID=214851 RepID=A0A921LPR6_9FIRM|nr:hypothetical protein [Subdoligranulum variabile]